MQNEVKKSKRQTTKALLILGVLLTMSLGKSATGEEMPCPLHPGKPGPDETQSCIGNLAVTLPVMNTDLVFHYHSAPSDLDKFYSAKNADADFFGKGWKLSVDASLFFNSDQSEATVILGDGTSQIYQKDSASGIFWPKDARVTSSYLQQGRGNSVIRTLKDGTQMVFAFRDSLGVYHLTSQRNGAGKEVLNAVRTGAGQIQTLTGYGFKSVSFRYSPGKAIMISNRLGQRIILNLASGLLQSVQFPSPAGSANLADSFVYDESGRLVTHSDLLQRTTQVAYYPNGAVQKIINPMNFANIFSYSTDSVTIKSVQGTEIQKFESGKIISISYSESGESVSFARDEKGRVVEEVHNGLKTTYSYVAPAGVVYVNPFAPTRMVGPDGLITDYEYAVAPEAGYQWSLIKRKKETGPGGSLTTTYAYDSASRLVEMKQGSGVYQYEYFQNTDLVTKKSLNGAVLSAAQYDVSGNLTLQTDFSGLTSAISVGGAGLPTSVSNSYGSTRINYDALDRPRQFITSEGTRTLTYGTIGNIETDAVVLQSGGSKVETNRIKIGP